MKYLRIYRQDLTRWPNLKNLIWTTGEPAVKNVSYWAIPTTHPNFDFIYLCVGDSEPDWGMLSGFGTKFDTMGAESRWQSFPHALNLDVNAIV